VVQFLIQEGGALVNQAMEDGTTPLYIAAQNGHLPVVQCLIQEGGALVNQAAEDGATPLFIAAQNGHLPVVQFLVQEGATVNQAKENGATPLIIAALKGHLPVAQYLIQQDAAVNQATDAGHLPLYAAAQSPHLPVVTVLASAGAIILPSHVGFNPEHWQVESPLRAAFLEGVHTARRPSLSQAAVEGLDAFLLPPLVSIVVEYALPDWASLMTEFESLQL
jgi:ankyrin repeat protein